jgi:hypothetical protein
VPNRSVRLSPVLALAVVASSSSAGASRAQEPSIAAETLGRHIAALAHDSMRGRPTPGPEIERAALYVEDVFRRAGLEPAGDGAFQQRFPIGGNADYPTGPNIAALLRGRDPALREEYVAVVAHMDHTGVGRPVDGDSIRNGADDNASGTAAVLALAEAFARLELRPRRSVLFLVVSGEERGLVGSRYFVSHPTVPIDRIVGLVNLDMISRNRPDSVYLNGWGKSTMSDLVRELAARHPELGLAVGPDQEDQPRTPADSDHYPFQRRGVPYVFFYTGSHPDYHRVSDHADRTDPDKAARVARLAFYTLWEVADSTDRPRWDAASRRLNVESP